MTAALLFVVAAGAAALLRLAVSVPLNERSPFPLGTLLVNLTGSLALGVLAGAGPTLLTVAGVGGLGTYTTFSKFAVEADNLAREGAGVLAVLYVLASCSGCVAAAWIGLAVSGG